MKRCSSFVLLSLVFGYCALKSKQLGAVSMNFGGNFRSETAYYNRLALKDVDSGDSKQYISARVLLQPRLVVDDHFSVQSQWNLLSSPTLTNGPRAGDSLGPGQGGYVFGDPKTTALNLSRVWLEWTTDFGLIRIGRMPVSWGYGLIWDAGNIWDDFPSTQDRLEYRLNFGHVIGAAAYSKVRKESVLGHESDQDFYTLYLRYDNPELEVDGGLLYEKQNRSRGQVDALRNEVPGSAIDQALVIGMPAGSKTPYPLSNNVVDAYLRKTIGYFTFGGEIGWLTGEAIDYGKDGRSTGGSQNTDSLNALGLLANVSYDYHRIRVFFDFMYVSGDADLTDDQLSGFVLLNRNRRPGLILGRELLGPQHGNNMAMGSYLAYGNPDTFSGVLLFRPGMRVEWSQSWASGLEFLIAQKASVGAGDSKSLGIEVDLSTEYAVYKNFDLGVDLGFLFPGAGLRVPHQHSAYAVRATAGLKF